MSRNDDAIAQMDRDAIKRLEVWLARESGGRAQVRDLNQLSGGAIQENWRLVVDLEGGDWPGTHDLVLRKDAPSSVDVSHTRAEEFTILRHAHNVGGAVPTPCLLCQDTSILGTPFFLMHRVTGTAAGHKLVRAGANAALAKDLGRNLARIHSIEDAPDLSFLERPATSPALASVARYRDHLDALPDTHPALEWALTWLADNAPETDQLVFAHRDYRTGNYMVDDGELTAILDWEFAGWSDRMEDIGWLTAKCWRFGATEHVVGGVGALDDFLRGYQAESGVVVDLSQLQYWQVMAHVRWAVIALQQADRFVSGGERNLELALTAHIVPELELEVLRQTAPQEWVNVPNLDNPHFPAPSLAPLLGIARDVVRKELVNAVDGEAKYRALMVANAMGIVERQIAETSTHPPDPDLMKELSDRIRSGDADAQVYAYLVAGVRGTLRFSNPRMLTD